MLSWPMPILEKGWRPLDSENHLLASRRVYTLFPFFFFSPGLAFHRSVCCIVFDYFADVVLPVSLMRPYVYPLCVPYVFIQLALSLLLLILFFRLFYARVVYCIFPSSCCYDPS